MLFKRIVEGKSMLNKEGKSADKCISSKSEYKDGCGENSTVLDDTMKMVLLGVLLWAGLTYGSLVAPYPLNLILPADLLHPPPMYSFPFPSANMLKKLPPIKERHLNQSLIMAETSIAMMRRLEENIGGAGVWVQPGSAAQGQLIEGYPSEEAMHYEVLSLAVTKASQNLAHTRCTRYGLPDDECASYISTLNLRETSYGEKCSSLHKMSCSSQKKVSRYRSYDGSCNNPRRASWGQALTGYKRLLHPIYADGLDMPRRAGHSDALPSARSISVRLTADLDRPDASHSLALVQWSQFVEHDLVHTPVRKMLHSGSSIACCDRWGSPLAPRYIHPSCLPIDVSPQDPFLAKHRITCMPYTRSVTTFRGDCTFGAAEQMNQATHFLDGSHIYGTSFKDAMSLRSKTGGLLKMVEGPDGAFMPSVSNPKEKCQVDNADDTCFKTGDVRGNAHPHLAAMHVVWAREHNRIARGLAQLNPKWGDEALYQEARRIVVAQLQHITYQHWMPALLGKGYEEKYGSYDTGYSHEVDPTVTNALATAGFHFVTSLLDGTLQLLNEERDLNSSVALARHFNRPGVLLQDMGLQQLLRGMVSQRSQALDLHYARILTQELWSSDGSPGLDAVSVAIQRGRDHGLAPYHQYRTLCGLQTVHTFQDFADAIPQNVIEQLRNTYGHAHDVDLVVGAMAETALPGAILGPTLACLLGEQMSRTRSGDRFFYTSTDQPATFTKRQLAEIRRTSLSRILCDNTFGLKTIQRDAFHTHSERNPLVSCEGPDVKRLSLEAWQDPGSQPDLLVRTQRNVKKWIKDKVNG